MKNDKNQNKATQDSKHFDKFVNEVLQSESGESTESTESNESVEQSDPDSQKFKDQEHSEVNWQEKYLKLKKLHNNFVKEGVLKQFLINHNVIPKYIKQALNTIKSDFKVEIVKDEIKFSGFDNSDSFIKKFKLDNDNLFSDMKHPSFASVPNYKHPEIASGFISKEDQKEFQVRKFRERIMKTGVLKN